jgi:hypothetical protein
MVCSFYAAWCVPLAQPVVFLWRSLVCSSGAAWFAFVAAFYVHLVLLVCSSGAAWCVPLAQPVVSFGAAWCVLLAQHGVFLWRSLLCSFGAACCVPLA